MTKPYAIVSDIHAHAWSAFASVTADGLNSRLVGILSEIGRAADTLKSEGGDTMIVSGDLFHVRGNIAPSVLNPTLDAFAKIIKGGVRVHIIPGNHDLEGKHSERLSSAVTALEGVDCLVHHWPGVIDFDGQAVRMVPWIDSVDELKKFIAEGADRDTDLVLHAPINGVIMGIPDHGLEPQFLQGLGYKRVFAGHYHNHKCFPGTQVYSVGAIGHHTWNDVGSSAGFVIVHEDRVVHHTSQLPRFVDVPDGMDPKDLPGLVGGCYARVRMDSSKASEIDGMRKLLEKAGALGSIVISVKKPDVARASVQVSAGASIEASVSSFVRNMESKHREQVEKAALRVLAKAEIE